MATYTLISSNVLTSSAASFTFSSIPATYTDLIIKFSARTSQAQDYTNIRVEVNGDSSTLYSSVELGGYVSATLTQLFSDTNYSLQLAAANGDTSTANTFSNTEIYFPNYTGATSKPFYTHSAQENDSAASQSAWLNANSNLYRGTNPITSVKFTPQSGSFVSGSSFYLYGISNA